MRDLLDKLSSYNIFNYLFPGVLFAVLAEEITNYDFLQGEILLGVFVYYFIGLVISRLGSVFMEPILRKVNLVTFEPYTDFIAASKKDERIDLLSEVNNMYRTLAATFFGLAMLKGYEKLSERFSILDDNAPILLVVALAILFLVAYRKQTDYLKKRIRASK